MCRGSATTIAAHLADAVSFVVMRERGIHRALTLDTDFAAEGFEVVPAA